MYEDELSILRCPSSGAPLTIAAITLRADDGEIIEGVLRGDRDYPITNGIPRFVLQQSIEHNPTWDYKWRVLDAGQGFNFQIIDKDSPAYQIHDIFDRNSQGGLAFKHATGGLALDLGCGVGQYSVKLLQDYGPEKVVSMDLTGGVDIFRKILSERYPHLRRKILIVQADVFAMPFAKESFDFVMSLGVLMHTGETRKALSLACQMVKPGGEINVWIYCSEPLAYDVAEPNREGVLSIATLKPFLKRWRWPAFWIRYFRTVKHETAVRTLRFLSSDFYFRLAKRQGFRWLNSIFMNVDHADAGYRLINLYDGYMNKWCDTWNEHELFPVFRENSIALLGMSGWRIGLWGRKMPGFYPTP